MRRFAWLLLCYASATLAEVDDVVVQLSPDQKIVVTRSDARLRLDGRLDEDIWATLPAYDEFVIIDPDTLERPPHATRVRFFYNKTGLYVGIDMDQPVDSLIGRLSGRDTRSLNRDSINITLDTSGEGRYGYWFGINLGDSLMDGTVLPERQFSSDWDGAWRGVSKPTETGWSAEFHIPWGSVSMPKVEGQRRIGLYMSRKVAYVDQRWGWPGLPSTVPKFMSALQSLEVDGVAPRMQYSLYPFASVTADRIDDEVNSKVGMDVFWRPSTNFQLTATINPDFGIVQSDDAVINLTALEVFFPERRLFFLEGQEIFIASPRADTRGQGVGNRGAPYTMVNTRRIGGVPVEPSLPGVEVREKDLLTPVDLIGAAKVTGQAGRFRYGVLAAFENDPEFRGEDGAGGQVDFTGTGSDYGVVRVLYEDAPGGAYRSFGFLSTAVQHETRDAYVHGLDGHFLSEDGKWKVDGQAFTSIIDAEPDGYGGFLDVEYTFRKGVVQRLGFEYFDEHVDINDLGFLQRNDNMRFRTSHIRTNSNISWARDNQFDVRGFIQQNNAELFTGAGIFFSNRTTFDSLDRLTLRASWQPQSYDDLNSFGNGAYRVEERAEASVQWQTNTSKPLSASARAGYRNEQLGGDTWFANASLDWRPSDRFAAQAGVAYQDRDGWVLHQEDRNMTAFAAEQWAPRVSMDYFISAQQQFRISMQWIAIAASEQDFFIVPDTPGELIPVAKPPGRSDSFSLSQINFQARYRWEIAPLSDLFVVYTRLADKGGAFTDDFGDMFESAYRDPLANVFVVRLRYRFGS